MNWYIQLYLSLP